MKHDRASRTAEYMALFRAMETFRPAGRRLFTDPLAYKFLQPSLKLAALISRTPFVGRVVPALIDQRWTGARTSGVARTRLIDDSLLASIEGGVTQAVILGAGFDCRAWRISGIEALRVFEVDHPATQTAKRTKLQSVMGELPEHIAFVGCDFNRQSLEEALTASGFDPTARSFFIWEGVTNYLTEEAVDVTLRFVGRTAPGTQILFTYIHRDVLRGTFTYKSAENLTRTLSGLNEAWTFGLDPAELPAYLAARNLRLIEDIGSVEYRRRYLSNTESNLSGYEFYRAALAEVGSLDPHNG
jgi:methyltransferase (TIGR00027 family)